MPFPWPARRRSAQPRPRLRLETLEDRATPATFTVNTADDELISGNGELSIREPIFKANAAAGADTIVLPAGVFKLDPPGSGRER